MLAVKRADDPPEPGDGHRILVDSLWPRGLKKERGAVEIWLRDVTPSVELRKWFAHDPARWEEFERRYFREMQRRRRAVEAIAVRAEKEKTTFLYGPSSQEMNNAVALKDYIERELYPRLAARNKKRAGGGGRGSRAAAGA